MHTSKKDVQKYTFLKLKKLTKLSLRSELKTNVMLLLSNRLAVVKVSSLTSLTSITSLTSKKLSIVNCQLSINSYLCTHEKVFCATQR